MIKFLDSAVRILCLPASVVFASFLDELASAVYVVLPCAPALPLEEEEEEEDALRLTVTISQSCSMVACDTLTHGTSLQLFGTYPYLQICL